MRCYVEGPAASVDLQYRARPGMVKRWVLGCVNSPPRLEEARTRDHATTFFTITNPVPVLSN